MAAWGIWDHTTDGMIHVMPCTPDGDAIPPHMPDMMCSCGPAVESERSDGKVIIKHNEVQ